MMKLGKVEKFSIRYAVLKVYAKFVHDKIFYKKVKYYGLENIPEGKPILIAPNHQNALMDALAIIFALDKQIVFLARSDIFQNSFIAKILYFLKILPVFRMRDGKEKLKLNEAIYNKTIQVLKSNRPVVIFPEAQHIDKKHLRKLKKGVQRIAFKLEEDNDFKADIQIIPTGIYYSNYWNFRTKLFVSFGKPVSLKEYFDDYKVDPVKTMLKFGNVLHEKIREQIIYIKDLQTHDEYNFLLDVCDKEIAEDLSLNLRDLNNKIAVDKETVRRVDDLKESDTEGFNALIKDISIYKESLSKFKLKDWIIEKAIPNNKLVEKFLILLIGIPVYLYGLINNLIPYLLPRLITKKLKDRQFESSIVYGLGIFTFPIFYILQSLLIWFITKSLLFTLIYFISLPIFGLLAFIWSRLFVKTSAQLRFNKNKNTAEMKKLIELRKDILSTVINRK
ncbi:MAG: hypothetical protein DRI94_03985 [Bacteroidetes bacterium]|nr:MAG: hypothetical protein DRI94_03985 [Bacteroidota bacterium]